MHACLIRCHTSFFNHYNFHLLLAICIVRTCYELSLYTLRHLWQGLDMLNCARVMMLLVAQLQIIQSLLAVLIFQNVILVLLATRIYLCKSFASSLKAVDNATKLQLLLASALPAFTSLAISGLGRTSPGPICWPVAAQLDWARLFFSWSHVLQVALVSHVWLRPRLTQFLSLSLSLQANLCWLGLLALCATLFGLCLPERALLHPTAHRSHGETHQASGARSNASASAVVAHHTMLCAWCARHVWLAPGKSSPERMLSTY